MSKNRYGKMQGNMNYNRPSGGYQKNLYKQRINAEGIKAPKPLDPKKLRNGAIALGVCWIVLTIVLIVQFKWWGLLAGMVIGAACTGGLYLFLRNKQKEMITYYKKIGMTEAMYVNELKKQNTDRKQIEASVKMWRKVNVDSVFKDIKK
jgi:hypothetical protein